MTFRELWRRSRAFVRRDALDREIDDELAAYLDMATAEQVDRGAEPAEARRRTLAALGGVEAAKARHRDARGLPSLDGLLQDVRYAVRSLRRSPAFTCAAVAMLAVGIGINAAVFTVTDAVLFRGFRGVDDNGRILYVGTTRPAGSGGCCVSYPDLLDWRAQTTAFDDLGAVADLRVTVNDAGGFPETYSATLVTSNTFGILDQRPILGRDFTAADEQPGATPVAILTHGFWQRRFGGNPSVIGGTARINGTPTTIIGVMPRGFTFPQNQDLWMPLVPTAEVMRRDARGLWFAFGRLADGVTFEGARAELATIGQRLGEAYPRTNGGWIPNPRTFTEFFVDTNAARTYGALWAAVAFVLLIACANLANLLLARAVDRAREISVRIALGASRWRVVRQLLLENLVLSALGAIAGWWLATWSVHAYALLANPPTRTWSANLLDYSMDTRVLAYVAGTCLLATVLSGLAPAFRLSRLDVNGALKDGGRGAVGGRRQVRVGRTIVGAEMALAVVLLAAAGVMARSFVNVSTAGVGIDTDNVVIMMLGLRDAQYNDAQAQVSFYDRLTARIAAIPGVDAVTVASRPPAGGADAVLPYEVAGQPVADPADRPTVPALTVGPGYFHTLDAPLLAGRPFTALDAARSAPVVIVNEPFVRAHWPGGDAVGQRVRFYPGSAIEPRTARQDWATVVGVAPRIRQADPSRTGRDAELVIYRPYRQEPHPGMFVLVRSVLPLETLTPAFRREIQALDADMPIWMGPFTLNERIAGSGLYWSIGNHAALLTVFAAVALLLAASGLYAVMANAVAQRTREIGVRLAMGGTERDVVRLFLRQGMGPVLGGLGVGLLGAVATTRLLSGELVNVSPTDPMTMCVASVVLGVAALMGCLIPAYRATRVDPVIALREQA